MNAKEQVIVIVKEYENNNIDRSTAIQKIKTLTGKDISAYEIDNYWRSEDLDNFAAVLAIEEIENWREINDEIAINLIIEILQDPVNDPIISRNTEALEKRYSKSTGTVTGYIFYQDLSDPQEILKLLKNNTTIIL